MQVRSHMSVLVHDLAKKYGEREALIYQDFGGKEWKSLSWNKFSATVKQVSNALLNIGVKEQENIGIFSQNSIQYLFCDFGAWGVRAVTIPFYATSSEQQIQFMINDAKVRFLFVGEQEQYDRARRVVSLCPTLERIIVYDAMVHISEHDTNAIYFDDFLKLGDKLPRQTEVEQRQREANNDDIANILYTSGTTGDSKGVILTHGQFHAAIIANDECVDVNEHDRVMNFLPYTHIFERGWAILCLSEGATLIVNTHPQEVQQSMRETHPTCMSSVPRFWEKVYQGVMEKIDHASSVQRKLFHHALAVGRKHNIEYLSLGKKPPIALHLEYELLNRTVFSLVRKELGLENAHFFPTAGAAVSEHVEEFVHSIGLNMIVGYGLTESLATVSCDHLNKPYTVGSVGRPINGIDIRISDEGEILLKGPTITKGYYNREDLTRQAFTEDGYFRTGDAGYLKNGELFLKERIKDLFKTSNGKYIAPQMIESKILVDKYIDQIAVIADQRKFVSALIIPVYGMLEEYARAHNIAFENREQLCANPQIYAMMKERIDTLQQQLAHYEQVKRFTLLPHQFSMEKGELTNTLKIRRRVLNENYKAEIDKMYED
ncbi:long-chain fatty acid--CoA ligase [Prevotella sp. P5-126]|uniref:Long-chain fatty acid--CoA ligase n=1 Tax=Xylanibacter brevis TaxID=83231 RepID=A0ABS9CFH2_9BACT|nr:MULTISPECIES: long-chain fatty acid--CoA ligase [Prevotellaceae]MBS7318311.1 long-chain fatty acid--CoA ligase [Prevotella sp.]MCF2559019.1 long-chain fatty acid--CoA ligase [Xylanibacter brevis]MCF2563799.1 long-chain fatty acid--CoA ligase [Xylanibacter brevis]MDY4683259.1 long-chain fatty acid--CoA ligase [Prevotella sp.]MEE1141288.1 long-chain fatty acid--CoA ligase [Prevotella sp.]